MRKGIAVFGGSLFQDILYKEGKFIPTTRQSVIQLSGEYTIDNYSYEGMTSTRAKKLIEALPMKKLYANCILALGEADMIDPVSFEKNLTGLIQLLQKECVRPLLVSLPQDKMKDNHAILIQNIIDRIAVNMNVDYIYEGQTSKLVSYKVLEDNDFTNAILSLC